MQTRGKPDKLFTPGTKTKPSEEAELGSGFTPSPAAYASGHTGPFALGGPRCLIYKTERLPQVIAVVLTSWKIYNFSSTLFI